MKNTNEEFINEPSNRQVCRTIQDGGMKITNLMVNDWVDVIQNGENHFAKVQMIDGYGDNATANECVCDAIYYAIDELKPIPLTPEILKKNGFKFCEYDNCSLPQYRWYQEGKRDGFSIEITFYNPPFSGVKVITRINTECSHDSGVNSVHNCDIECVHELQHALKLCGIEKEIEL